MVKIGGGKVVNLVGCLTEMLAIRLLYMMFIVFDGNTWNSWVLSPMTNNYLLYCSYLCSIHEKANCIAIFWTGRPHSLGSCHFRDVWATCLPHKCGGVPLSALPKDTTSEVAGLFSTNSRKCRTPSMKAVNTIF